MSSPLILISDWPNSMRFMALIAGLLGLATAYGTFTGSITGKVKHVSVVGRPAVPSDAWIPGLVGSMFLVISLARSRTKLDGQRRMILTTWSLGPWHGHREETIANTAAVELHVKEVRYRRHKDQIPRSMVFLVRLAGPSFQRDLPTSSSLSSSMALGRQVATAMGVPLRIAAFQDEPESDAEIPATLPPGSRFRRSESLQGFSIHHTPAWLLLARRCPPAILPLIIIGILALCLQDLAIVMPLSFLAVILVFATTLFLAWRAGELGGRIEINAVTGIRAYGHHVGARDLLDVVISPVAKSLLVIHRDGHFDLAPHSQPHDLRVLRRMILATISREGWTTTEKSISG
jgi:hypothetical protein